MARGDRRPNAHGQNQSAKSPNPREKKQRRTDQPEEKMEVEDEEMVKKLLPTFEEHSIVPILRALKKDDPLPHPQWGREVASTAKWDKFGIKDASPFDKSNIFGEESSSFHESVKILKYPPGPGKSAILHPTVDIFLGILTDATKGLNSLVNSKLFMVTSRLARSDPEELFSDGDFNNERLLLPTDLAKAWAASVIFFGCQWRIQSTTLGDLEKQTQANTKINAIRVETVTPTTTSKSDKPETGKKLSFGPGVNENPFKFPANPYRMNKPQITVSDKVPTGTASLKKHHHVSFVKAKLATTQDDSYEGQAVEAGRNLQKILQEVWKRDIRAEVLPWGKQTSAPSITNKSKPISSREGFRTYVERGLWTQKDRNPYVRFKLAHHQNKDTLFSSDLEEALRGLYMGLYFEVIQDAEIAEVGSFLGSHPSAFVNSNWMEAHAKVPALANIQLEFRLKNMTGRVVKSQISRQQESLVRAVHVYASRKNALVVRNTFLDLYSSRNRGVNPLGQTLRFIPNVNDTHMITTADMRRMAALARNKQQFFLQNTFILENRMSLGLYFTVPQLGINLKEAIMAIRSQRCPERNLFAGVEESADKRSIILVYHGNVETEAQAINDGLPLYLAQHLGPRVWSWFSMETRASLAQCFWDDRVGMKDSIDRVQDTDMFETEDVDEFAELPEVDAENPIFENLPTLVFDPSPGNGNYFGDAGTINSAAFRNQETQSTSSPTLLSVNTEQVSDPSSLSSNQDKVSLLMDLLADPVLKGLVLSSMQNDSTNTKPQNDSHGQNTEKE